MDKNQLELFEKSRFYTTDFEEDAVYFKEKTKVKLFSDGLMTAITGRTQLDLIRIEKAMVSLYTEYATGNCSKCSLVKFLTNTFGEDIQLIVHKWTIIPEEDEQVDV